MSRFQQKIMSQTKKNKSITKEYFFETAFERVQMTNITDKYFKATVINMLKGNKPQISKAMYNDKAFSNRDY